MGDVENVPEKFNLDLIKRFSSPLCSRDPSVRELALTDIEKNITDWLERLPNGDTGDHTSYGVEIKEDGNIVLIENNAVDQISLLTVCLPAILRLSVNCPFQDVRDKFVKLLFLLKEKGITIPFQCAHGPSEFIPSDELATLGGFNGTNNEQAHTLFIDAFLHNNRLDHVTQVMGYHPKYLDCFLKTQNFILRGDGPLPYDYRHFIAIMAAGRHQCSYLINIQKQEFLLQNGNPSWLKGLQAIPQKLKDLYDINKILAHRPWLINRAHIQKLTKGSESWSLAEVVHAIVILTHFHALSSFVFGCGVNEEIDHEAGRRVNDVEKSQQKNHIWATPTLERESNASWSVSPTDSEVDLETLMERMKSLSQKAEECSQEEAVKRFQTVETQSAELNGAEARLPPHVKADVGHFVEDAAFLYQDFAKRGIHDIATFRVQDYSWDDQGYSLVNSLYNDVGNLLDDKFKTAYNLTYHTMGGRKGVDTTRFRMAVWNYIQCMFGIRHDDYDYGEVNQLLERSLKAFIKSTCCYPECVTKKDYDRVLREFEHSEKVHVNLMILEARMQAELLYALRAVMCYMTTG